MLDQTVVDHMVAHNGVKYNLRKAAEEFQELALVLMQKTNKKDDFVDNQEIIDERGDVIIRLEVLKKLFPMDQINQRVADKMDKFRGYIETKKYSKF